MPESFEQSDIGESGNIGGFRPCCGLPQRQATETIRENQPQECGGVVNLASAADSPGLEGRVIQIEATRQVGEKEWPFVFKQLLSLHVDMVAYRIPPVNGLS